MGRQWKRKKDISLHLQGIQIIDDFLPLELGSSDVILGIQWLETLGTSQIIWKEKLMKFRLGNEIVTLCGDLSLGKTLVSLNAMLRTIKHEGVGILVGLNRMDVTSKNNLEVPQFLHHVLVEHEAVFNMPSGRGRGHSIVFKEGHPPTSDRSYRYPYVQKDEIE